MSSGTITYIVTPLLSAALGGIAWLVKRYFEKNDEEQKRIFEQRDKDKQEMKDNISNLQSDMSTVISSVVSLFAGWPFFTSV